MSSGVDVGRDRVAGAGQARLRWAELLRSPAAPWIALAVVGAGTAVFLFHETRGITVWFDEWIWVLRRRGDSLATFLDTHNGHLSLIPVAIYKLLYATAGLRTYAPYRIVLIAGQLTCCGLLFVYARRRVGDFLALVATAVLLLFGPGWENLLWPFQIAWLVSLAAGLGALLAIERRDRGGDLAACVLAAVSLASSGIGVPFALGLAVEIGLQRSRWRQWWIVGIPLALYALWSIGYQHTGISRHAFVAAPNFIATHVAATFGALAGLGGDTGQDGPGTLMTFGPALLVAALALAAWRLVRLRSVPRRVVVIATIALSFWLLTALTRAFLPNPYSSRYLYVSALLLILLAVELGAGARLAWWAQAGIAVVAAGAIASNVGALRNAARVLRVQAQVTKADLGALQIGRPVISSGYVAQQMPGYPFAVVRAGDYFAAARALGSPASTPAAILADPEPAREAVDRELIGIHRVAPLPAQRPAGPCRSLTPAPFAAAGSSPHAELPLPAAGVLVRTGSAPAAVGIRRFAEGFQYLGTLASGSAASLRIAPDAAPQPWQLQLGSNGPVTVCPLAG